jgi:hypothetical protein
VAADGLDQQIEIEWFLEDVRDAGVARGPALADPGHGSHEQDRHARRAAPRGGDDAEPVAARQVQIGEKQIERHAFELSDGNERIARDHARVALGCEDLVKVLRERTVVVDDENPGRATNVAGRGAVLGLMARGWYHRSLRGAPTLRSRSKPGLSAPLVSTMRARSSSRRDHCGVAAGSRSRATSASDGVSAPARMWRACPRTQVAPTTRAR